VKPVRAPIAADVRGTTYVDESPESDEVPRGRVSAQPNTMTSKVKTMVTQTGPFERAARTRQINDADHPMPVKRRRRGVPASLRVTFFAVRDPPTFIAPS
jgi:hypothetical protein